MEPQIYRIYTDKALNWRNFSLGNRRAYVHQVGGPRFSCNVLTLSNLNPKNRSHFPI